MNDVQVTPKLYPAHSLVTRGNDLRFLKGRTKYDLQKFYYTNRIVNLWNSLPNNVAVSYTHLTLPTKRIV